MKRSASHAGSWYSSNPKVLSKEMDGWLKEAKGSIDLPISSSSSQLKAIISPHAGYSYCGPTGAYGFGSIDKSKVKRIFVLGPSHHVYIEGCALSKAKYLETPFGDFEIDEEINKQLKGTGRFAYMSSDVDEDEHSIEMQLPFLAHVVKNPDLEKVKVVEILVGNLEHDDEVEYGKILAPYFNDPSNFFVISSDFCHWGNRFQYQPYDKSHGEIWQSIEHMDKQGMGLIESKDHLGFSKYLKKTNNTICGRHPIGVLLGAIGALSSTHEIDVKFVHYTQSSKNTKSSDSSVSYASGLVFMKEKGSSSTSSASSSSSATKV